MLIFRKYVLIFPTIKSLLFIFGYLFVIVGQAFLQDYLLTVIQPASKLPVSSKLGVSVFCIWQIPYTQVTNLPIPHIYISSLSLIFYTCSIQWFQSSENLTNSLISLWSTFAYHSRTSDSILLILCALIIIIISPVIFILNTLVFPILTVHRLMPPQSQLTQQFSIFINSSLIFLFFNYTHT